MSAHLSVRTSDVTRFLFDVMDGNIGFLTGCGAGRSDGADCMQETSEDRPVFFYWVWKVYASASIYMYVPSLHRRLKWHEDSSIRRNWHHEVEMFRMHRPVCKPVISFHVLVYPHRCISKAHDHTVHSCTTQPTPPRSLRTLVFDHILYSDMHRLKSTFMSGCSSQSRLYFLIDAFYDLRVVYSCRHVKTCQPMYHIHQHMSTYVSHTYIYHIYVYSLKDHDKCKHKSRYLRLRHITLMYMRLQTRQSSI